MKSEIREVTDPLAMLAGPLAEAQESASRYWREHAELLPAAAAHLCEAALLYLRAGGKALRPALVTWSCQAVGADGRAALPVAAAVELYHTWTLVHDDVIDRDSLRRGVPTVHCEFAQRGRRELGLDQEFSDHYGLSTAILAGDLQHAWAVALVADGLRHRPELAVNLIHELEAVTLPAIMEGEALDLEFSQRPVDQVSETQILEMLSGKTGALYRFCALAGAVVGLGRWEPEHPLARALADFASRCGLAFQLQDDVLGVTGDERRLGKPVGSDIREGKRTLILRHAWEAANPCQRELILSAVGNPSAGPERLAEVTRLLEELGGVAHVQELAREHLAAGLTTLGTLPESDAKRRLVAFGHLMVARNT